MNDVIDTLLAHRSIRCYQDKPVAQEDLNRIIDAVQAAPNWVNFQLVSVIVVKDPDRRKRFAALCGHQRHVAQAPVFLVFCADYHRASVACARHDQTLDDVLEDIDTLIVGAHEVGIAVATAGIAAESLGLGTVVIGDIRKQALEVIDELHLPRHVIPVLGMCIGYAAEDPDHQPRLPKQAMYFEERYNPDLAPWLDRYDQTYAEYLKARPFNNRIGNWTQLISDFYRTPYHYRETARMLKQQGFPGGHDAPLQ